jgi:hypothetical protein
MTLLCTTELDAVNVMLDAISESPVATLDEDTLVDAGNALRTLRFEARALQSQGWNFNTDENAALIPDAITKEIVLPANLLSITFRGVAKGGPYTYRGGKVYDRTSQTFEITTGNAGQPLTLYADMVLLLPFGDMPEAARRYVTIKSARRFQDAQLGDTALHQFGANDEEKTWAEFLSRESEDMDLNVNRDSPSVAAVTILRRSRY